MIATIGFVEAICDLHHDCVGIAIDRTESLRGKLIASIAGFGRIVGFGSYSKFDPAVYGDDSCGH